MSVLIAGIDENGLGPRLGPLVATCALVEVESYERERLRDVGRALGLDDSKRTSGFKHMSLCESVALACLERQAGSSFSSADSVFDFVALGGRTELQRPCPDPNSHAQCWSHPLEVPAFGGSQERGHVILEKLNQACEVKILNIASTLACPNTLNRFVASGRSKLALDLKLFESLMCETRKHASADIEFRCGMVGGIRDYQRYGELLASQDAHCTQRKRGVISYEVKNLGSVHFEVKADAEHLPVALASMVGKYLRELWMERINRFYRQHLPELRPASGYHDSVTRAWIEATAHTKLKLGVVSECFEREA